MPKLPSIVAYVFIAYHLFWVFSSPIQSCLGCNQIFWFTSYAPYQNHLDYLHPIMATRLLCLGSITHHNFQFGLKGFEHLIPFMVLVSIFFSSRNFLPQAHQLCGLMCFVILWIEDITPLQQVCDYIMEISLPSSKVLNMMDGIVPKSHVPFGPNGEQQIKHNSPFCMKGWGVGHKSSLIFSTIVVIHSQSSLKCVAQFMLPIYYIFGKLSWNISNIPGHDVKPCGQNVLFSWYFTWIFISFTYIYVAWLATKIHVSWLLLEFHWVAFTNISASLRYYSFVSINIWL